LSTIDGSVDATFHPDPDGDVSAIAVDASGNVYVAGTFTSIGGVSGRNLVKMNGSTGAVDPSWNPVFPSRCRASQRSV